MQYGEVRPAIFLERPNRFIARVLLDGQEETVHVKNTGRCREILLPGTSVYLEKSSNPDRKTKWSLITAVKENRLINIDSQAPNRVVEEALLANKIKLPGISGNLTFLKREVPYGSSRFDFYYTTDEQKGYIEVKGVTLEREGGVFFPDAPTPRGTRHLKELASAVAEGYQCYAIFLVQMTGAAYFAPNRTTDPAFAAMLEKAKQSGVIIEAIDCQVTPDSLTAGNRIPVLIDKESVLKT